MEKPPRTDLRRVHTVIERPQYDPPGPIQPALVASLFGALIGASLAALIIPDGMTKIAGAASGASGLLVLIIGLRSQYLLKRGQVYVHETIEDYQRPTVLKSTVPISTGDEVHYVNRYHDTLFEFGGQSFKLTAQNIREIVRSATHYQGQLAGSRIPSFTGNSYTEFCALFMRAGLISRPNNSNATVLTDAGNEYFGIVE